MIKRKAKQTKTTKERCKPSENEVDGLTEVKDLGQDNLQHGKEYGVKLGSSILSMNLKFLGRLGSPARLKN